MTTLRLPEMLRKYASGNEFIEVEGRTISEALGAAVGAHPDLGVRLLATDGLLHGHLSLFHQDRHVPREEQAATPVGADDRLDLIINVAGGSDDVRMRGFEHRATVEEALRAALNGVERLAAASVAVGNAAGRVLVGDVISGVNVPSFRRATMDGYAVLADDTYGASAYSPVSLTVVGESLPGSNPNIPVVRGSSMRIMTGAPVPDGQTRCSGLRTPPNETERSRFGLQWRGIGTLAGLAKISRSTTGCWPTGGVFCLRTLACWHRSVTIRSWSSAAHLSG